MHEHAPELVRQDTAERKFIQQFIFTEPSHLRGFRSRRCRPAYDVADVEQLAARKHGVCMALRVRSQMGTIKLKRPPQRP
jgi:hypothetical protein